MGRVVWVRKWEGGGRLISKRVRKGREGDVRGQRSGRGLVSGLDRGRARILVPDPTPVDNPYPRDSGRVSARVGVGV